MINDNNHFDKTQNKIRKLEENNNNGYDNTINESVLKIASISKRRRNDEITKPENNARKFDAKEIEVKTVVLFSDSK